jgi:ubiquinone/menaquinone biosynthesis C-methylase UbiE
MPNFVRKAVSRLAGRSVTGELRSVDDIRAFKENAWKSKRMATFYREKVENRFFERVTARLFLENLPPNAYVLDVGAGTGRLSRVLADSGLRVVACDVSREMLAQIEKKGGSTPIETLESNARNIPLPNDSFDAVVSMDLMVHFPDWEVLLREQARLCKPGGVIMFNFLNRENIQSIKADGTGTTKDFYYVFDFAPTATEAEIDEAAGRLGLSVEEIYPYNFFSENALFCRNLNKAQVDAFVGEFNEKIRDDAIMEFVELFEETIVRNLPKATCSTMMIKLRKPIQRYAADVAH